jgi:hypothetical protein
MRSSLWLLAVAATLGLASSSRAQFTIAFGGTNTGTQNVPVTVPSSAPIATPQTVNTKFSLVNFMPRFALPQAQSIFGHSIFPGANQLAGREYLKAFGYARPGPIGP